MQFIPSTWSIVGVDADGDAKRNPQDIDDAALATAVYLCSGKDDLSTVIGQRAAVYRYNHSQSYVDLVLSIMDAYLDGDFTTIPNNTTVAGYIVPEAPTYNPGTYNGTQRGQRPTARASTTTTTTSRSTMTTRRTRRIRPIPTDPTDPPDPTNPGNNNGGTDNIPNTNTPIDEPLEDLWTLAEATAKCVAQLLDGVANPLGLNVTALLQSLGLIDDKTECVNNLVGTPQP